MADATFEYLLFDTAIATAVVLSTLLVASPFRQRWAKAVWACLIVAVPYLVWDSLVVDRHWWFNSNHIISVRFFGLPFEEWLFFFTVPIACLMTWEVVWRPHHQTPLLSNWVYLPQLCLALAGVYASTVNLEYTALACLSVPISGVVDILLGTKLYKEKRYYGHLFLVCIWVTLFDGYLAGRPVVLYGEDYFLGVRLGFVPIEDYAYAIGWVGLIHSFYTKLSKAPLTSTQIQAISLLRQRIFSAPIRRRLNNYRESLSAKQGSDEVTSLSGIHPTSIVNPSDRPAKVAVIGGGLAGLRSALTLAKEGVEVDIFEQASYFGGKVGSWTISGPNGETQTIEHGFHAFFRHYYNLNEFLRTCGATNHLVPIDDYLIMSTDDRNFSYRDILTTPIFNLISLMFHGHFRLRDVLFRPSLWRLLILLKYDAKQVASQYDHISYAQFAEQTQLPEDLQLTFNSFSRAFFSPPTKMSTAELIKSFHFFFLSNDAGLLYDYLNIDYHQGIISPITTCLQRHGVRLHLETKVTEISKRNGRFKVKTNDREQQYDAIVLASDIPGTKAILANFQDFDPPVDNALASQSRWQKNTEELKVSSSYAVWRIWTDTTVSRGNLTPFVITQRRKVLDSITFYERVHKDAESWANTHQGSILELHSYCIPDDIRTESMLRQQLREDLEHFLPELTDATIVHEHLQWRRDFPAFHVGQYATRPTTRTPIPGLVLAGDWVKLPVPAMLMEAACTSGLFAANEILLALGRNGIPISTVPRRGIFA